MFQVMCKLWLCSLSMCQECAGRWSREGVIEQGGQAINGIRERMTLNENGQAVEPAATVVRFSHFMGMIAQECSLFPINTKDWRSFYTGTNMEGAWMRIKQRSVTAARNRRLFQLGHTTGTRSFAQVRYEYEKLKDYKDRNEEVNEVVRHKVYLEVLGPEKKNKVRGFGAGVSWLDVPGVVTQERAISRELQELRSSYELQLEASNLARQEVVQLWPEAIERENRLNLEAANLVEKLRKEQPEAINMQKNQMELEITGIKRGMIEFMSEFRNTKGKDKVEDGNPVAVLQSWLNKVDLGTAESGPSKGSGEEDYEFVGMDTENGALPSMPQGNPNN